MRVPSHPLRNVFRPDTPVETFGLVPRATCSGFAFVPAIVTGAAVLVVAAVVAEPLLKLLVTP
jgi:hypothetical protein